MRKMFQKISANKKSGYFRFKQQLKALKSGDLRTVINLGYEAGQYLELKKRGRLQLSFVKS